MRECQLPKECGISKICGYRGLTFDLVVTVLKDKVDVLEKCHKANNVFHSLAQQINQELWCST